MIWKQKNMFQDGTVTRILKRRSSTSIPAETRLTVYRRCQVCSSIRVLSNCLKVHHDILRYLGIWLVEDRLNRKVGLYDLRISPFVATFSKFQRNSRTILLNISRPWIHLQAFLDARKIIMTNFRKCFLFKHFEKFQRLQRFRKN